MGHEVPRQAPSLFQRSLESTRWSLQQTDSSLIFGSAQTYVFLITAATMSTACESGNGTDMLRVKLMDGRELTIEYSGQMTVRELAAEVGLCTPLHHQSLTLRRSWYLLLSALTRILLLVLLQICSAEDRPNSTARLIHAGVMMVGDRKIGSYSIATSSVIHAVLSEPEPEPEPESASNPQPGSYDASENQRRGASAGGRGARANVQTYEGVLLMIPPGS